MRCELSADELHNRGSIVMDMLVPLVGTIRPAYERQTENMTHVYFVAHTGPRPISSRRDWRFSTFSPHISGGYLERWMPTDERGVTYYLDRSYLHLYRKRESENAEEELLGLHCDPNEPSDIGVYNHAIYKRGPHIHIQTRHSDFHRSHIALNLMQLDLVLGSVDAITDAMRSGIKMLRDQVLDLMS